MTIAAAFSAFSPVHTARRYPGRVCTHRTRTRCCQNHATIPPIDVSGDSRYDTQAEAIQRWNAAQLAAAGGSQAFLARLGGGVATALSEVYPEEARLLIICGNGRNGEVGLRAAAALVARGHSVCAYYASERLPEPIQRAGVEHVSFIPSTADYYWDVCIDAVLGIGYDGSPVRDTLWVPYEFLTKTKLPVASVDVPSGWDVDTGPRNEDRLTDDFVKPRLLISLGRPKRCAQQFGGALHYVFDWEKTEAGGEKQSDPQLFASNAQSFLGANGEVYGKPGLFEATLYTKRESKRVWVYPDSEEDDELWDELD